MNKIISRIKGFFKGRKPEPLRPKPKPKGRLKAKEAAREKRRDKANNAPIRKVDKRGRPNRKPYRGER